jgi:hypothetical protein
MQLIPIAPKINGTSYSWSDIQLSIAGGIPVVGITAINYADKREVTPVYGAGSEIISYGYGNHTFEASITMKFEEVKSIVAVAPNGDLTQIPDFTITIAFLDTNLQIVTHKLMYVRFLNNVTDVKQNDTSIDVKLDLIIASIVR